MVERDATATLAESLGGCGGLLQQILHLLAWLGLRPRNRASAGTIRALSGPSEPRQLRQ
jgi:transposase